MSKYLENKRDAERYRFLRDVDLWGEDSGPYSWEALADASCGDFDEIVDKRMEGIDE